MYIYIYIQYVTVCVCVCVRIYTHLWNPCSKKLYRSRTTLHHSVEVLIRKCNLVKYAYCPSTHALLDNVYYFTCPVNTLYTICTLYRGDITDTKIQTEKDVYIYTNVCMYIYIYTYYIHV